MKTPLLLACASAAVLTFSTLCKAQEMKKAPIDTIFEQGEINPYGKFFTGQTYLTRLNANDEVFNAPIGNVTFEPGARTNWHKHSGGWFLPEKDDIRNAAKTFAL